MKEIKLNEEVYVLKSDIAEQRKKVDRFDIKTLNKLHTSLKGTLFQYQGICSEEYYIDKELVVIDGANIQLISAKSERAKRFLCYYKDPDTEDKEFPKWVFKSENKDENIVSAYSLEVLNKLLRFLEITDDKVKIRMKRWHPIQIENEHFIVVLAPRVTEEDKDAD